jgi:hypothetical protein
MFLVLSSIVFADVMMQNIAISKDNTVVMGNISKIAYLDYNQSGTLYATHFCYQNGTCISGGGSSGGTGNTSFNQSLTDSLYYLNSNPNNYINTSNLTAYNTTAQLYTVFYNSSNPRNYINSSNLSGYAQYQFTTNNFNGSGNFTTTGTGTFGIGKFTNSIYDNNGTSRISINTGNRILYASDGTTRMINYSKNDRMALGPDSIANNTDSFSFGYDARAYGEKSMALGIANLANGYGSLALGFAAGGLDAYSVAIGVSSSAQATRDVAIGTNAFADGFANGGVSGSATAIGDTAQALNQFASAVGAFNYASGDSSFAYGSLCQVTGTASGAIGLASSVSGDYSLGLGIQSYVSGDYAVNIGSYQVTATAHDNAIPYSTAFGGYNGVGDELWLLLQSGSADFQSNNITTTGKITGRSLQVNGNVNITGNTSIGQMIKLTAITLPSCASATNGTIARNSTKLYFCDGVIWNGLY